MSPLAHDSAFSQHYTDVYLEVENNCGASSSAHSFHVWFGLHGSFKSR